MPSIIRPIIYLSASASKPGHPVVEACQWFASCSVASISDSDIFCSQWSLTNPHLTPKECFSSVFWRFFFIMERIILSSAVEVFLGLPIPLRLVSQCSLSSFICFLAAWKRTISLLQAATTSVLDSDSGVIRGARMQWISPPSERWPNYSAPSCTSHTWIWQVYNCTRTKVRCLSHGTQCSLSS